MTIIGSAWRKEACPACGEEHWRGPDVFSRICWECRIEFGVQTDKDVQDTLDWLASVQPGEVTAFRAGVTMKRWKRYGSVHGGSSTYTPPPKVDPEKVALGIRAMTHYGVIPDEGLRMDTNFVFAKNGAFEVRHSDVADIILPLSPAGTSIPGLTQTLTAGVHHNLPLIPFDLLGQTVAFFRGVMKRFNNGEAIVRIWWNVTEQRYEIRVPDGGQQVSGASVHHQDTFDLGGERDESGALKYVHVMDIHSHNNMSGFWSGVDDNDERKAPEGRMFGVFGKVTQIIPDWKWRMRSREGFIELKVTDLFEVPALEFDVTSKVRLKDLIVSLISTTTLECLHDPFAEATCPEAWYATVNVPVVRAQQGHGWFRRGEASEGKRALPAHVASYIYVKTGEFLLEEFEVDANDKVTPTGITCPLKGATHDRTSLK